MLELLKVLRGKRAYSEERLTTLLESTRPTLTFLTREALKLDKNKDSIVALFQSHSGWPFIEWVAIQEDRMQVNQTFGGEMVFLALLDQQFTGNQKG